MSTAAQLVPPLQHLHRDGVLAIGLDGDGEWFEPAGHRLAVANPGVGRHDDPRTGDLATPRQVEVLAHCDDAGIEALELAEEIAADEHAAAGRNEDVAHRVVLPVVDLAGDDAVHHGACLVAAHPDVEQDAGVVPIDELRGDDAGIGAERFLDQLVDRVGVERHVVVAEQEERCPLDHAEHLVRGGGVPGPAGQLADECIRQETPDPLSEIGVVPGREDEHRELPVVLRRQ